MVIVCLVLCRGLVPQDWLLVKNCSVVPPEASFSFSRSNERS